MTLYTFSTENFTRKSEEVEKIMQIAEERFRKLLKDERIHRDKVHVKIIGRVNLLPKSLQEAISDVEKATASYDQLLLEFRFRVRRTERKSWMQLKTLLRKLRTASWR